ncbi:hypothetical protein AB7C87_18585 [Natrarchaeobius sp. A-rgal3]|uniref:hypothetical protein n=1 Tax=Natrarchaeobius versutus TaxID=1679078 RepID=UPI003510B989
MGPTVAISSSVGPLVTIPSVTHVSWSSILWALAVLLYGVGDLVTTMVGLGRDGVVEGNAGARFVLGDPPSWVRFAVFKAVLLSGCYGGYLLLEGYRIRPAIPAGIAAIGLYAVVTNVRVLGTF